jgi:hypothetical protein
LWWKNWHYWDRVLCEYFSFSLSSFHLRSKITHLTPSALYSQEQKALLSHILKEFFGLLGCYAAYPGSCLKKFRDSLSVPFSNANALHCLFSEDGTHAQHIGKQIPAHAA